MYRWRGKFNMGPLRRGYSDMYMLTGLEGKQLLEN